MRTSIHPGEMWHAHVVECATPGCTQRLILEAKRRQRVQDAERDARREGWVELHRRYWTCPECLKVVARRLREDRVKGWERRQLPAVDRAGITTFIEDGDESLLPPEYRRQTPNQERTT